MKMVINLNDENLERFPSCLREIADKMEGGKSSEPRDKGEYYFTVIDDTVHSRKFIIYSNDGYTLNPNVAETDYPMESNNSQILGITFGTCMKKALYRFLESETGQNHLSQGFSSFTIREIIGEPKYVNTK